MGRAGLMSATELDEVQALLGRVIPDPTGFAQRLLLQAMAQWGPLAEPGSGASSPSASTFYTAAEAEDVDASDTFVTPDQPAEGVPADTNILLAGALGACVCWGLRADCDLCGGQGSTGWTEPVTDLFDEFVGPAIARLPNVSVGDFARHVGEQPDDDSDNQQTTGEDA
jgi:hypothetical protein